ncbi:MAG: FecR domain-containing protein [Dysgonamonadaceae bacterium]|nr:FecR domain-containing protein [Dysgonamonadaceae bacterium]
MKKQLAGKISRDEFLTLKELFLQTDEILFNSVLYDVWMDYSSARKYKSFEEVKQHLRTIIQPQKTKSVKVDFRPKLLRWAAVVALMISSAAIAYLLTSRQVEDVSLVECAVPNGETRTVVLPDASKVTVNAGSMLIYPEKFGKTRYIYLNGEAYFSVIHNPKQPFVVKTMDFDVEVMGTVFNVSSYIDDEKSTATLKSGEVKINFRDNSPSIILQPNEQLSFERKNHFIARNQVDVSNAIAWIKGNLVVQGSTLEEIARIIERKYGLHVYLNTSRYPNDRLTMKFSNDESIDEFMSIMRLLLPNLRYKIEDKAIYIY